MTSPRTGGGIDEQVFYSLLNAGVPRNKATRLATMLQIVTEGDESLLVFRSSGREVSTDVADFLTFLVTTDASGQNVQGFDKTLEELVGYLDTTEGTEWATQIVQYPTQLPVKIEEYKSSMKEYQKALKDFETASPEEQGEASRKLNELWDNLNQLASDIGVPPDNEGNLPGELTDEYADWLYANSDYTFLSSQEQVSQPTQARTWAESKAGKEGLTPQQAAFEGALGAEHEVFQKEYAETLEASRTQSRTPFNISGAQPQIVRPTYSERFGNLPGGAGSPLFREFVETQSAAVRAQVEALPPEEQLPFLRKRLSAMGPKARGDYSTANLAPRARWLTRR